MYRLAGSRVQCSGPEFNRASINWLIRSLVDVTALQETDNSVD